MTLTPARLPFVDLFAAAVIAALAVHCYGEPEPQDPGVALARKYAATLEDAGLGAGLSRLNGLSVRVHPGSDGGSWPNERFDGGPGELPFLFDDASYACASYPTARTCWVNDLADPIVCHCFGHVTRSDRYDATRGLCFSELADGLTDHDYFNSVRLDEKCRLAAKEQ